MYRYDVKIRLDGSVMNEVRKRKLSAAEVMILRRLHGMDAVLDIVEFGNDKTSHEEERQRLQHRYVVSRDNHNRTKLNLEVMFGPEHMGLPDRLPDFAKLKEVKAKVKAKVDDLFDEDDLTAIAG